MPESKVAKVKTKLTSAQKNKIKNYLKSHGHATSKVDALVLDNDVDAAIEVASLHGVTAEQFQAAER